MQLKGDSVRVTGGATGIGRGLAEALHRSNNKVVIAGRREESLAAVAHASPEISCVRVDLADPSSIQRFCQEVADQDPGLNVLRNSAGLQQVEEIDAVLAG
jgi:uncharacterized oxidoreductase